MEISPAARTILIILAYAIICPGDLCAPRHAPGVHTAPGDSRFGKVNSPDPGGAFQSLRKNEHNVFFPHQDRSKLNPERQCYQVSKDQNQISFGKWVVVQNLFNIINIISQTPSKEYSGSYCAITIHKLSTCPAKQAGKHSIFGNSSRFGLQRKLLCDGETERCVQKQLNSRVGDYLSCS